MTDSLKINQSVPEAGLGTFSYTVTAATAGMFTCECKSFLPYIPAGSPPFTTQPSAEVSDVTLAADSAGSLNSTYWTFNSAGDLYGYYVWYNINSAGVDPAVTGRTGIEVAGATNASANTLATATRAAILASTAASYVAVSGATSHVILTNKQMGGATNAANGVASPGFTYSITAGSYGVPEQSGLNIQIKKNSTVLVSTGFPSPTQPILSAETSVVLAASDVISVVLSSLSSADSALNAVKSIINLYQGK